MKFFIIADYPYEIGNVKERIVPALFNVDNLFRINKEIVKSYLKEHINIFNKRALWKFDIDKTLKFIKKKVAFVFTHYDYVSNIIDVPELSYRIICIDCEKTDTLFYKNELETENYLVYFASNCGYNIIGNDQLVSGAILSALTKDGVDKWKIEKTHFNQYVDCDEDIEEIINLLYFDNERNYIKITCGDKVGELILFKNYVTCDNIF